MANNEWISIEEQLPGESGSYLICTKNRAVCTAHFYSESGKFSAPSGKNAVYWMPLPKPPKMPLSVQPKKQFRVVKYDLRECPFCGNNEAFISICGQMGNKDAFAGNCPKCGARSGRRLTRKEAAKEWNRSVIKDG
jgi:Lar family restriction alleviation protein